MVKFPADETGRFHKLPHLWHGFYRIFAINELDISVSIVYYHQDGGIQVHQSRVKPFPSNFFLQGSTGTGERGEDQVVPVEQTLADNQQNEKN